VDNTVDPEDTIPVDNTVDPDTIPAEASILEENLASILVEEGNIPEASIPEVLAAVDTILVEVAVTTPAVGAVAIIPGVAVDTIPVEVAAEVTTPGEADLEVTIPAVEAVATDPMVDKYTTFLQPSVSVISPFLFSRKLETAHPKLSVSSRSPLVHFHNDHSQIFYTRRVHPCMPKLR